MSGPEFEGVPSRVVLGQIGEHAEPEPESCRDCGRSATSCGRSRDYCCSACSGSRFGTHYPAALAALTTADPTANGAS